MKKKFGKKQAVLAAMVLLLGAAVYLNYYVASNTPLTAGTDTADAPTTTTAALGESQFVNNTTAATTVPQDHFSRARADREAAREEALAILKDTLQDVKLDEAGQKEAMTVAAQVAAAVEQESTVENLVKAKGFEDCVVYIAEDFCHVTVKAESLSEAQTLQIAEIVIAQTDVSPANINILSVA